MFFRTSRMVRLTREGEVLFAGASKPLDTIADAVERIGRSDRPRTLTVTATASFAAKWLVPRLDRFRERAADPRLVEAAKSMLEDPAREHTLASLAASAGMSRSGFAARFTLTFGYSPIEFLKRIRLQHAARLLERTDLPIGAVAGSKSASWSNRRRSGGAQRRAVALLSAEAALADALNLKLDPVCAGQNGPPAG